MPTHKYYDFISFGLYFYLDCLSLYFYLDCLSLYFYLDCLGLYFYIYFILTSAPLHTPRRD